jgi:AraC-like DNA-binding protein
MEEIIILETIKYLSYIALCKFMKIVLIVIDAVFNILNFWIIDERICKDKFRSDPRSCYPVLAAEGGSILQNYLSLLYTLNYIDRIKSAAKTTPSGNVMSFFVKGALPRRLRDGIFILSEEQVLSYTSICDSASAFLSDESTSGYAGQEIADRLAAFLIRLSGETVHESTNSSPSAIEYKKIVTAMSNGVCENKTLSDFAVECGDSVSYIKQLFSKYAGASPKACYNKLRIRYAAKLLDEGETVRFVAQRMNFPSSNYFSSFFKKYTGLSPLEYKQRER